MFRLLPKLVPLLALVSVAQPASAAAEASVCAKPAAALPAPILVEGKRFTVELRGSGPDVLLIPGLSTPRAVWEDTAAMLAPCYRLHLVQLRGFGDAAGANAEGLVLEPFIAELADYIDDEIVGKGRPAPAIIGHSLGGLSGLMIGARHPQMAGRIMVVDALPFIGPIFGANDVASIKPNAEKISEGMRAQYQPGAPAKPQLDCNNAAVAAKVQNIWSITPRGQCIVENWSRLSDPRVSAQAMLDDTLTDMRPELPQITAPVTLVYAQDDSVFPEAIMRQLFEGQYTGTPKFKPVMVKGSYHFITLDQPGPFSDAVKAFLRD